MGSSALLNQPEYVHVTINHFPLIGLFVAMLALAVALLNRNRTAVLIGLALLALLALSVWPVSVYGEAGYDRVLSMSDDNGQAYLRYHQHLADRWAFLYYITAAIAALGFGLSWKWPRVLTPVSIAALLLAAGSLCAGVVIAEAGGRIRHREFRRGPPPEIKENSVAFPATFPFNAGSGDFRPGLLICDSQPDIVPSHSGH